MKTRSSPTLLIIIYNYQLQVHFIQTVSCSSTAKFTNSSTNSSFRQLSRKSTLFNNYIKHAKPFKTTINCSFANTLYLQIHSSWTYSSYDYSLSNHQRKRSKSQSIWIHSTWQAETSETPKTSINRNTFHQRSQTSFTNPLHSIAST